MKRVLAVLLPLLMVVMSQGAAAGGDAAAGEALAEPCVACHGADANTPLAPTYPRLGGQNERYMFTQLKMIKDGTRSIPLMAGQLDNMSESDLEDMAAYFASLPKPLGQTESDDETLANALNIYRGGILDKQVAACSACHSPRGAGNDLAGFPRIAGQSVDYTIAQLTAYREGDRETDEAYGGMMRGVAAKLTDKEIAALADLLQGLH